MVEPASRFKRKMGWFASWHCPSQSNDLRHPPIVKALPVFVKGELIVVVPVPADLSRHFV
jgi:hypothetical protein